ncbi:hypothetical protein GRI33_06245 [Brucella sp. BO3]|uniref:hypothetical protein n=1 Tax=unclassified Brucella TaxID=2632610 RepID=UPI00084FAB33|nr:MULTISPECIES: hypothetical protein [unclassified Brucella]OEI83717.1 hypothetical protein BA060_06990 [Brucella sp. B13-0095]QMV26550.1 hypothetical protein GRI33_06245 [Brucella sp. BO3]
MAENKIIENDDDMGLDWRSDAASSLERREPEKAAQRGRGRPKGAGNRKTKDFQAWYEAQGFKDPLQLQAEFMSSDPVALQSFFLEHEKTMKAIGKKTGVAVPALIDIVKEQMACARDLAPYLHGKAPVRVVVEDERLPMLVINSGTNQIDQARQVAAQKGLTVGRPMIDAAPNKINDLAEAQTEDRTTQDRTEDKSK